MQPGSVRRGFTLDCASVALPGPQRERAQNRNLRRFVRVNASESTFCVTASPPLPSGLVTHNDEESGWRPQPGGPLPASAASLNAYVAAGKPPFAEARPCGGDERIPVICVDPSQHGAADGSSGCDF